MNGPRATLRCRSLEEVPNNLHIPIKNRSKHETGQLVVLSKWISTRAIPLAVINSASG